ncbi:response regulator [Paenibacillus sp. P36]|uniref:response regulator transcription factor n=1 Tax=Paenibacillus sp. P36 TaxID=3342538 RepID=UPI0038B2EF8D
MIRTVIIEDEALIRKSLSKLVSESSLGFDVIGEGANGVEGFDLVKSARPDLLITDIKMPQMNGLDLIKNIKSLGIHCEFIILSGYSDFSFAQEAIHYGVSDYLLKPIRPEQLRQTLHKVKVEVEKHQIDLNEYSEWLLYCTEEAKNMAHFIWNVNETEVMKTIDDFNKKWIERQGVNSQYKVRSIELLSRIYSCLCNDFGAKRFDYDNKLTILFEKSREEVQALNKLIISTWLQAVRETRNYGAHLSIKQVTAFIENNYKNSELSLQMVADQVKLSVPYLSQVFKQSTGISFSQYLIQTRMEKAKQLLSEPDCKAYEIPDHIGYTDYPHFTKSFKKYFGISPREFRAQK